MQHHHEHELLHDDTPYDVAVIGSGPAGCATAVTAAAAGARVTLLAERLRPRNAWAGESLPPGGESLVHSIFGDGVLSDDRHRRAHGVRGAWGSDELVDTDFIAHPRGEGWHLDRRVFDDGLRERARQSGARVVHDRVVRVERHGHTWTVTGADGELLTARWLVDATGRTSMVGRSLGGPRHAHDRQIALVTVLHRTTSVPATTVIEAVPDGWWYCTPLPDDRLVVALLTDPDLAPSGNDADRVGRWWRDRLARTSHIRALAGETSTGDVEVYRCAANTSVRMQLHGEGWMAVGDAAIGWDPLSSQGLVTGMLMGARAGSLLGTGVGDIDDWDRDYRLILDEHLALRYHYWRAEMRWPDAAYWARRR